MRNWVLYGPELRRAYTSTYAAFQHVGVLDPLRLASPVRERRAFCRLRRDEHTAGQRRVVSGFCRNYSA